MWLAARFAEWSWVNMQADLNNTIVSQSVEMTAKLPEIHIRFCLSTEHQSNRHAIIMAQNFK